MAYSKTIYYVLDLINSGFVREMNEKDAREYVLSGKGKLYDKDNNCVANENPWLDGTKTEPAKEAVANAKPEQPVEQPTDESQTVEGISTDDSVEQPAEGEQPTEKTQTAENDNTEAEAEQPVEESAEVTNEENQEAPKKGRKAKSE